MTEEEIAEARALWKDGFNTAEIAEILNVAEWELWNRMLFVKGMAKAKALK